MVTINKDFLTFVRPSEHSTFSPSSADRWLKTGCPFSVRAAVDVPLEPEQDYAKEGTLAHAYAEALYLNKFFMIPIPNYLTAEVAMRPDFGEGIIHHSTTYVDEVLSTWLNDKERIGDVIFAGEEKAIPIFPDKSCFGTSDFVIVGTKGAAIIDFKYGAKPVPASSLQLKVYAAGLSRWIENPPKGYEFHAVIFQPKVSEVPKEHTYSGAEVFQFLGTIWESILESEKTNLVPVEGNHCFWCPLRRTKDLKFLCPVKKEKPLKLAEQAFEKFLQHTHVQDLSGGSTPERDAAMIKILKYMPALKEAESLITEELMRRIEGGEVIQGVAIDMKLGNREIIGESTEDKINLIKEKFPDINPVKIVTTTKIRGIGELEKELGKGKLSPICQQKVSKVLTVTNDSIAEETNVLQGFAKIL